MLLFSVIPKAQNYTGSGLRISLITCAPGDELYSLFGHTAFRVVDSVSMTDIVYNYGTFNFDDPNFYVKFARGKLRYYLSIERYDDFLYAYLAEGRSVTEQILQLNEEEKITLRAALTENLKEENRYYQYDFFLDNCTTRPRDIILKYLTPSPQFPAVMPEHYTFRNAIHQYLDEGKQYWSKLGIDILLGSKTDKVMTSQEQLFLPDNLLAAADSSLKRITVADKQITQPTYVDENKEPFFKPFVVFLLFAIVFVLLTFPFRNAQSHLPGILHKSLFFFIGILGIILVLMWWGTDHSMTKNNFNLLWALPTHFLIPVFLHSTKKWVRIYLLCTAIITTLTVLLWYFLPQQMNPALLPLLFLIIYSSILNLKK